MYLNAHVFHQKTMGHVICRRWCHALKDSYMYPGVNVSVLSLIVSTRQGKRQITCVVLLCWATCVALGSTLNMGSDHYQNRHFLRQKWTEIRFWLHPNKWIIMVRSPIFSVMVDDDMMMTGHFVENSFPIEFWSKIKSTGIHRSFFVLEGTYA